MAVFAITRNQVIDILRKKDIATPLGGGKWRLAELLTNGAAR